MSGKSPRRRGKHSFRSQKRKGRLSRPLIPTQKSVVPAAESVFLSHLPAPSARAPTETAKPVTTRYPDIAIELRTIAILAGILLLILVVLALVLA